MAITRERLIEIRTQRQRILAPLRAEQKKDLRYAHLEFRAGIPENLGYRQRTPPTAQEWISNGLASYTFKNPRVTMLPRGDTPTARKLDGKCEAFGNYLLRENVLAVNDAVRSTLEVGEGIICLEYDDPWFGMTEYKGVKLLQRSGNLTDAEKALVKEWQQNRAAHMPLRLRYVDPISTLPSPVLHMGMIPGDMFEDSELTAIEAQEWCETHGFPWKLHKKGDSMVHFIKYTSPKELAYMIEDQLIWAGENPLGFVNYLRVGSGYGRLEWDGDQRRQFISVTRYRRDMLKMEARSWSQADALVSRQAYERVKLIGDESDVKRLYPTGDVPVTPQDVIREIKDRVEVDILHGEPVPVGLFEHLSRIEARAQVPMVLGGGRPTGVYSGEHQEMLVGVGKTVYKAPFTNWERALQIIVGWAFRIIEDVYQRPIQVALMSPEGRNFDRISKTEIAGHRDCSVEFMSDSPEASDFRKSTGAKLRVDGSISKYRELTEYHGMSVREAMIEIARVNAERILESPDMQQYIVQNVMQRMALRQQAQQAPFAEEQLGALGTIMQGEAGVPGGELPPLGDMGGIPQDNRDLAGGVPSNKENELMGVGIG